MNNADYIPRPQAVFNNWQETLVAYLLANLGRFGLTTDMLDALMALQAAWRDAWALASNPDKRTKATVQAKNEALAAYKAGIRQFVNERLTYNKKVTNADRDNMGLPIHDTHPTPAPVSQDAPDITIRMPAARRLEILARVLANALRKKPDGGHGWELRWIISLTQPTSLDQITHSEFSTRSAIVLDFDENQRGQRIWLIARWENTRGQKGPWTDILSAIIP
ncbi:MAG: hypothetical protein LBK99_25710 [Opitutaceae bacterium]|jgi:bisphosphoglycerate-dependent phosphoglycerate mutase|nr:hypothetical protein [Opitutaceae bacterium]